MEKAWAYHLKTVEWQYFVTLTLRPGVERFGKARLWALVYKYHRAAFKVTNQVYRNGSGNLMFAPEVKILTRFELGEITGRKHFHALYGGYSRKLTKRELFALKNRAESFGIGHARVHVYNQDLPGVEYVLKGGYDAARRYEIEKTAQSDTVRMTESVLAGLVRQRSSERVGPFPSRLA